jgi:hypothetical protein
MTPLTGPRRHVLVVASQCASEEELAELGEIATSLRDIFLDPYLGCCEPGLPNGKALLDEQVAAGEIIASVEAAIEYAARDDAILLLAFLGHGFIPGVDPTLYFMGWNSVAGDRNSGVNIRDLLTRAADTPGIRGVAGIIDTCTAAAAIPGIGGLTGGTLTGQTRLSLVMASAAGQPAYNMALSRRMAGLLRAGVPEAGTHLWLSAPAVKAALRGALPGQPPVFHDYDGAVARPGELWLARNARAESGPLGSYGLAELAEALTPLLPGRALTTMPGAAELRELHRELATLPASPARIRAERLMDSLEAAHRTAAFLRSFMPERLGEEALRRALAAAGGPDGPLGGPDRAAQVASEVDAAECAALSAPRYPRGPRPGRPQLARFVAALADDAGLDLGAPALRGWAASVDAIVPFNDAVAARGRRRAERRLRLIVSLHYSPSGDWPDKLGAWLLYDGVVYQSKDIDATPDQRGAEEALAVAVDWAVPFARGLGVPLRRVEVAVPVGILLRWQPEDARHVRKLGLDYQVLTRWSRRLDRSATMRRVNTNAELRLEEIDEHKDTEPVQWLHAHQVANLSALLEEFVNGRYSRAIGLMDDPGENNQPLFEVLLEFAPILLWPRTGRLGREHEVEVITRWGDLPAAFTDAYRAVCAAGDGGPLADLRVIWDDEEWLSFCRDLWVQPGGTEE